MDFEFHAHDSRFQGRVGEMVLSIADMTPDPWSCILGRASEKRCTDPRDKMYGILGLLRGTTLAIQPRYTAPVVEVYRTAMLQHVPICGAFGSPGSWLLWTTNCLVPLPGSTPRDGRAQSDFDICLRTIRTIHKPIPENPVCHNRLER